MKIVCISDTHGLHHRLKVPYGDVLIHAGDFTERGEPDEVDRFLDWLEKLPHEHKVFIAGNHEFYVEERNTYFKEQVAAIPGVTYLEDSGSSIGGLNFWGSPVQPWFYNWAFNRHRGQEIKEHWDLIPADTNVLITHGPPLQVLDQNWQKSHQGCADLLDAVSKLSDLKLHVFGHIHPPGGTFVEIRGHKFVNAAQCDERGYLQQRPVVIQL